MPGVELKPTQTGLLRILIVDDIQATRHSTSLMLNLMPGTQLVATAANGQEAVELVRHHRPDLVIMDVNMPKMDGPTALAEMRRVQPNLKCLIISSERDELTLKRAREAGAFDFLVKPFTSDELLDVVTRVSQSIKRKKDRPQTAQLRDRRDVHLLELAAKYAKARRKDDKALAVYEELAKNPYCDEYWLKSLAMMYVLRMNWGKLKLLAARLEQQT